MKKIDRTQFPWVNGFFNLADWNCQIMAVKATLNRTRKRAIIE
jgi:hypothetical protein